MVEKEFLMFCILDYLARITVGINSHIWNTLEIVHWWSESTSLEFESFFEFLLLLKEL